MQTDYLRSNDDYKKLGIRGIFGDEKKLDEIEIAILEKNRAFHVKKNQKAKEAKIDDRIKNLNNNQLKTLIKQDRLLLSKKKRVWAGKRGNFNKEQLYGYFRKIDAMKLYKNRKKYKQPIA